MKRRKNSNLHVVREPEDPTDKIIEEIMDELNSEDGVTEKEIQEELARRKRKKQKKIGIVIAVIAIAAILVYLLINLQTYTKVRVSDTYVGEGAADNNYVHAHPLNIVEIYLMPVSNTILYQLYNNYAFLVFLDYFHFI